MQILGGVRHRLTIGSPVSLLIHNLDYPNWEKSLSPDLPVGKQPVKTVAYPGHADLPGAVKYGFTNDLQSVTERASARETAARVAVATVAKSFLDSLGIRICAHVVAIGQESIGRYDAEDPGFWQRVEKSNVRCGTPAAAKRFRKQIDQANENDDSVGGIFEVLAFGVPIGLGSYVHWDRKLSTRLAAALMSINAVKGVEVGDGFKLAGMPGRQAQDQLYRSKGKQPAVRKTNHAGGLEGGVSNGETIVLRAAMKPISSAVARLSSIDIFSHRQVKTGKGRSDVTAVPSAAVVGEAMVALVLADAVLEKFGGDSLNEVKRNLAGYLSRINKR